MFWLVAVVAVSLSLFLESPWGFSGLSILLCG
jgi:hypothetical protein